MRVAVSLLIALSAGFAAYLFGAIGWAVIDPLDSGRSLLFTIPIAIAGTTFPALIGLLIWMNQSRWDPAKRKARAIKPQAKRDALSEIDFDDLRFAA